MYYTGKGDSGLTSFGQGRVPKGEQIFELVGGVDELNSLIGLVALHVPVEPVREMLLSIQNDLFTIGADLYYDFGGGEKKVTFREDKVKELESAIDEMARTLPPLTSFVIPGGSEAAAYLHVARAVCRRVEREAVRAASAHNINPGILRYLNRLSSYFFVAALYCNAKLGIEEKAPKYS
ncbi:cob(I)yrinic acid a,c-diamide adenosyltransferase [Tardisphaera miroshnichenkoae]